MKILIVDDAKAMRMIVTRTLRQAGFGDLPAGAFLIAKPFSVETFADVLGPVLV